jgi:hypothetical protein
MRPDPRDEAIEAIQFTLWVMLCCVIAGAVLL